MRERERGEGDERGRVNISLYMSITLTKQH